MNRPFKLICDQTSYNAASGAEDRRNRNYGHYAWRLELVNDDTRSILVASIKGPELH